MAIIQLWQFYLSGFSLDLAVVRRLMDSVSFMIDSNFALLVEHLRTCSRLLSKGMSRMGGLDDFLRKAL